MDISNTNVSAEYADGYREAIKDAAHLCRTYGYTLDGGNNQGVHSRDALLMAELIEKLGKTATAGAPSQAYHVVIASKMMEEPTND